MENVRVMPLLKTCRSAQSLMSIHGSAQGLMAWSFLFGLTVTMTSCHLHHKDQWGHEAVDLTRHQSGAKLVSLSMHLWKAPAERPGVLDPYVFDWPLDALDVTSPYGHRMHPVVHRVLFHRGIDLAAPKGTMVQATAPGVVEFSGRLPLTGNTVILAHPGGIQSLYAHMDEILVWPDEVVEQGAAIGMVGSTGRSTGPHLHFQMERDGHSTNPADLLGQPPPRSRVPLRPSIQTGLMQHPGGAAHGGASGVGHGMGRRPPRR